MKKLYESPTVEIEEFELENVLGNLCSSNGIAGPIGEDEDGTIY